MTTNADGRPRVLIVEDDLVTSLDLSNEPTGMGYEVCGFVDTLAPAGRSGVAFGLLQVGTKLSGFAASLAFGGLGLKLATKDPQSGLVALIAQLTIGWWLIRRHSQVR